jgi:hypothetical protein
MAMTLILSQTADSDTNMDFVEGTSGVVFDSTYKLYVFKVLNCVPEAGGQALCGVDTSTDAGSSYGITCTNSVFQAVHNEGDTSASLAYNTDDDLAQSTARITIGYGGTGSDEGICGTLLVFNPSNTTYVKHYQAETVQIMDNDVFRHQFSAGYWNTTSALDAFRFKFDSSDWSGTVKLYGVS